MQEPLDQPSPPEPELPDVEALKEPILAAIGAHLREHGPKNWKLVREHPDFAHVIGQASGPKGARRFWRWVAKVSKDLPADRTKPHDGRAINHEHAQWSEEQVQAAAQKALPTPPPAAFFMKEGADGLIKVELLEAFGEIWADLQLARQEAFEGPEGARTVRSSKQLTESAVARLKTLAIAVQLQRNIYDIEDLHRRYRAIFDFVMIDMADLPERQMLLLQRMRDLNSPDPIPLQLKAN